MAGRKFIHKLKMTCSKKAHSGAYTTHIMQCATHAMRVTYILIRTVARGLAYMRTNMHLHAIMLHAMSAAAPCSFRQDVLLLL